MDERFLFILMLLVIIFFFGMGFYFYQDYKDFKDDCPGDYEDGFCKYYDEDMEKWCIRSWAGSVIECE